VILVIGVGFFYLFLVKGNGKKFEDYIKKNYSAVPAAIVKESNAEEAAPTI
jgi:hypothetical protein